VEAGEVPVGGRRQGDEALHEGLGGEGEGAPFFRAVLEAAVVEFAETGLGDGPSGAVPAEALEALSVLAVDGGVCMQAEAVRRGEASRWPLRQGERQRLLEGAQLECLEVVLGEGDVDVLEVLPGEAQHAEEDGSDVVVGGRGQRHEDAVDAPEGLGDEEVEGR
jgi:hypothetical protein